MMKQTLVKITLMITVLGALVGSASPAQAVILFDFNSLSDSAGNSAVQTYMNGILGAGKSVVVAGSEADKSYDGDNHVVGPFIEFGVIRPLTLGTTDGGVQHADPRDTFLMTSGSDRITMTFSFPIYEVAFDYEIFPDNQMPDGTGHTTADAGWPDFKFRADGGQQFRTFGDMPGAGSLVGLTESETTDGDWSTEKAPQYLGQSGTWTFANGVTTLEFVDWPVAIGIDNLTLGDTPPGEPIPEPASLALMGLGLAGLIGRRRLFRR